MTFADRTDAGHRLAHRLAEALPRPGDAVVLGLPRGGVPVAAEVAAALHLPLDVLLVHKLGVPFQPEFAMGAVDESGYRVIDDATVRYARVSPELLDEIAERQVADLVSRGARLRRGRPPADLRGRTAIIVDDGAATGLTALAACHLARAAGAKRVVVGLPVASREAEAALRRAADQVECVLVPPVFNAVGQWYDHFGQTSDSEVVHALDHAERPTAASSADEQADPPAPTEVQIPADGVILAGTLTPPGPGHGIVLFAHGSGSSRHSPRNRFVAEVLHEAGLGTLLFDLLTPAEDGDRSLVFDVALLARRLLGATAWLRSPASGVPPTTAVGYFGASTGAAAALVAAATPVSHTGVEVAAVVSRGGRPDLAGDALGAVRAPTLLIVGSHDHHVLTLNRTAQACLRCESRLEVVPGATHLFEEAGTLQEAAALARDWFAAHLR